jgi:threonine/homoserine/homoserine lactone efflux protein
MLALIAQGIGYGFTAGTSPGPFQGLLINLTLSHGWRKSIGVIFAPLIADIPIILLMTFLLKDLPPQIKQLLQLVGGLFLLWIAWSAYKRFSSSANPVADVAASSEGRALNKPLAQGVMMIFLSPGPYIYWGTVTGPLLVKGLDQSLLHGVGFLLGFYVTFLSILASWVVVFDRMRRLDARIIRTILLLTIGILVALGLSLIWQGLGFGG